MVYPDLSEGDVPVYGGPAEEDDYSDDESGIYERNAGVRNCPMHYENWYKGEPNWFFKERKPESCVNIWPKLGLAWNDEPCSRKHCFVCERRPTDDCP